MSSVERHHDGTSSTVSHRTMRGRSTGANASASSASTTSTVARRIGVSWPSIEAITASRCGPTTATASPATSSIRTGTSCRANRSTAAAVGSLHPSAATGRPDRSSTRGASTSDATPTSTAPGGRRSRWARRSAGATRSRSRSKRRRSSADPASGAWIAPAPPRSGPERTVPAPTISSRLQPASTTDPGTIGTHPSATTPSTQSGDRPAVWMIDASPVGPTSISAWWASRVGSAMLRSPDARPSHRRPVRGVCSQPASGPAVQRIVIDDSTTLGKVVHRPIRKAEANKSGKRR